MRWVVADVTTWSPERCYGIWHDRAFLHFLTDPADREAYVDRLVTALHPGSHAIIATIWVLSPRCRATSLQRASVSGSTGLKWQRTLPLPPRPRTIGPAARAALAQRHVANRTSPDCLQPAGASRTMRVLFVETSVPDSARAMYFRQRVKNIVADAGLAVPNRRASLNHLGIQDDARFHRDLLVEQLDMFVRQTRAAVRYRAANAAHVRRAVDAQKRVAAAFLE